MSLSNVSHRSQTAIGDDDRESEQSQKIRRGPAPMPGESFLCRILRPCLMRGQVRPSLTVLTNAPVDLWWIDDLLCGEEAVDVCAMPNRRSLYSRHASQGDRRHRDAHDAAKGTRQEVSNCGVAP